MFGLNEFLTGYIREHGMKSNSITHLVSLSFDDFQSTIKQFPKDYNTKHNTLECPFVFYHPMRLNVIAKANYSKPNQRTSLKQIKQKKQKYRVLSQLHLIKSNLKMLRINLIYDQISNNQESSFDNNLVDIINNFDQVSDQEFYINLPVYQLPDVSYQDFSIDNSFSQEELSEESNQDDQNLQNDNLSQNASQVDKIYNSNQDINDSFRIGKTKQDETKQHIESSELSPPSQQLSNDPQDSYYQQQQLQQQYDIPQQQIITRKQSLFFENQDQLQQQDKQQNLKNTKQNYTVGEIDKLTKKVIKNYKKRSSISSEKYTQSTKRNSFLLDKKISHQDQGPSNQIQLSPLLTYSNIINPTNFGKYNTGTSKMENDYILSQEQPYQADDLNTRITNSFGSSHNHLIIEKEKQFFSISNFECMKTYTKYLPHNNYQIVIQNIRKKKQNARQKNSSFQIQLKKLTISQKLELKNLTKLQ